MNNGKLTDIKNAPEILSVVVSPDDASVFLKWCPAVGADKYIIQRKAANEEKFTKAGSVKSKFTEFTDRTVLGEGEYAYRIAAKKNVEDGDPITKKSKAVTVRIKYTAPVSFEKVVTGKDGSISFSWKPQSNVDGYVLYRRYSFMKKPIELVTLEGDCDSYVDSGAVMGQLYYYSIRSFESDESGRIFSAQGDETPVLLLDKAFLIESEARHRKKVRFAFRLTAGADGYAVFRSSSENGEFRETAKTEGQFVLECTDIGEKKARGAYYCFACYRNVDGKTVYGAKTKPIYIKYKL